MSLPPFAECSFDLYETLGVRVRKARERRGMTQEDLARALGWKPSARSRVSRLESGEQKVGAETLCRLAVVLETTTDHLLGMVVRDGRRRMVVTYRLAYLNDDVTLCATCAKSYHTPLGSVQHGARMGWCEECQP